MTEQHANKQAAIRSKKEGAQYVVWVFDQGREIFDADQARRYSQCIHVEAVYVDGAQVSKEMAV